MLDKNRRIVKEGHCIVIKGPHRKVIAERNNEVVIAYERGNCYYHVPKDYDRYHPALFHYSLREKYSRILNDYIPYLVLKFKRYIEPNEVKNADFAIAIIEEPIAHRVYGNFAFHDQQGKEVEPVMNVKDAIVNNVPMIDIVTMETRLTSHGGAIYMVLLPRGYSIQFTWRVREFREVTTKELKLSF